MSLDERKKGALENYLGPKTGPSSSMGEELAYFLVVPPGELLLNQALIAETMRTTDTTEVMTVPHPGCLVSGIDLIRSSFRTCSRPYCLVTSDYMWGCCYIHTCDCIEQLIASLCLTLPDEIKQWC